MSNVITMAVNPVSTSGISISASANPVYTGSLATFTAVPVNGGATPVYQWQVNGVNAGNGSSVFAYVPENGDAVMCSMISGSLCSTGNPAASNTISMNVILVALNTELQNVVISDTRCYDAIQTVTLSGNGSNTTLLPGSNVTLIAGQNILLLPSTTVNSGGYLLGYITTDGIYCAIQAPSIVTVVTSVTGPDLPGADERFRIYPNPSTGNFMLEVTGANEEGAANAEIYGSRGDKVLTLALKNVGKHEFSLSGRAAGIYYVRVSTGTTVRVMKIILSNPE